MCMVSRNNFDDRQLESVIYSRKIAVISGVESRWKIIISDNQYVLVYFSELSRLMSESIDIDRYSTHMSKNRIY